jgi:hypothetical protein
VFRRRPEGWLLDPVPEDGRLVLHSIGFEYPLDALYEDVMFARSEAADTA